MNAIHHRFEHSLQLYAELLGGKTVMTYLRSSCHETLV